MSSSDTNSLEELDNDWRYETKYRINVGEYFAIKNQITSYLKRDPYTSNAPLKKYLVRSLYFDTHDYQIYKSKINGDCDRIKFRIRTYGTNPEAKPDIRVEMKVRKGNVMEKYGCFVTFDNYQKFMNTRHWIPRFEPVLIEFERYIHKWNLSPKTLVQYQREGFQSIAQEDIRLTFDHHITSGSSQDLFPESIFWHRNYQQQIVLEVKHRNNIPNWLRSLIQLFYLKVISNSKYTNSIEVASKDIF